MDSARFFLAAALWAAVGILLWVPQYVGALTIPTNFSALDWHVHEMLYGYVPAAIAGFLLTAIPNWTGRLPVNGWPLAGFAFVWLAGRAAILLSAVIGSLLTALVDVSFLIVFAAVAAREVIAGKNWRNLRVLVLLCVLIFGNIVFHAEVLLTGASNYGPRIGIAAIILLISFIGGRIVPSFTNNWLARNNPGRLPVPFSLFDMVTVAGSALALLAWVVAPTHVMTGALLMVAACLQFARVGRWAGDRTLPDRLVLVLHVAYVFVPIGFLLIGASVFFNAVPATAGVHAWSAGAIGLMTLAVMTRASLGHTGRPLQAGRGTELVYLVVLVAAVSRIIAAFIGSIGLIELVAVTWVAGFLGFVMLYGPLLATRKPAWSEMRR
ncbi:MAG TPA: NnrS family protein [Pseudolabrys sp.]|nr:NnrS family protein [Pseudolabrys sp.]